MRLTRRILGIALFVALLVGGWRFAAENAQVVSVHYLLGSIDQVPVWQVLFCAFLVGVLGGFAVALVRILELQASLRNAHRSRLRVEGELSTLRNLPLEESEEVTPQGAVGP